MVLRALSFGVSAQTSASEIKTFNGGGPVNTPGGAEVQQDSTGTVAVTKNRIREYD